MTRHRESCFIRFVQLFVVVGASLHDAQGADAGRSCATQTSLPANEPVTLVAGGFPGARIPLYARHPDICPVGAADGCQSTAYLIPGDKVLAGADCDSWTFVKYVGAKKITMGWIESSTLSPPAMTEPVIDADAKGVAPICRTALKKLNDDLLHPSGRVPGFKSAVTKWEDVDHAPEGVAPDSEAGASVGDAIINGHAIKVVKYFVGGTCFDNVVKLWTPGFRKKIDVAEHVASPFLNDEDDDPNPDPADRGGYSNEELSEIDGRPYFVHYSRGAHFIKLYRFGDKLSNGLVCEFALVPRRPEVVQSATAPEVCEAAARGQVQPINFDRGTDAPGTWPGDFPVVGGADAGLAKSFVVSRQAKVDLYNNGKPEPVAMVTYSNSSGAGCGYEIAGGWPNAIEPDGHPRSDALSKAFTSEIVGSDDDVRLFRYQGATYFEQQSSPMAWSFDGIHHEIWKPGVSGATKVCDFLPSQYVLVKSRKK